jgi:cytochrome c oxidase subunit 2
MLLALPLTFELAATSTVAAKTDLLYNFIYWASVASFIPTIAAMIYFGIKYREGKNADKVLQIDGNHTFEWVISAFMSVFFMTVFVWGYIGFIEIRSMPENAYEINVVGQQWLRNFEYSNGKTTTNDLYIPRGVPVKLIMTSKDVIHSFFVPQFRVKQDVVPGLYSTLWFNATKSGENDIYCAEFCGAAHSNMLGKVHVLEPEAFKVWLAGGDEKNVKLSDVGAKIFKARNCVTCHTLDGKDIKAGPTMAGLFGKTRELASGENIVADENYVRNSILNPQSQVVKGFPSIMPTYKGQVTEDDLNALIAYVKSLKNGGAVK